MTKNNKKLSLWLILLPLLTPGSCYAFAAFMPDFRQDFALIGVICTFAIIGLMAWRVLDPTHKATVGFKFIVAQGLVTLPLFLISYRFWLSYLDLPSLLIFLMLLLIYIIAWSVPIIIPSMGLKYLSDFRFPKSLPMRIISRTALALGGGSAVFSMYLVRYFSDNYGSSVLNLFLAILTTAALIFGIPYLAMSIWEEKLDSPTTTTQE